MKALLDTNIIIHRENQKVSNYSIGHLFRWLDKLHYEKFIHPESIKEIQKYRDAEVQKTFSVKLYAYETLKVTHIPDQAFLKQLDVPAKSENDRIDNCLLYEVYTNHVDILITEDRKLRNKANRLNLNNRVFSINSFISKVTAENPSLIEYKALAVKKIYFGKVNVKDSFFDSFRDDYADFENWFERKCNEEAYICYSDSKKILGFLYLKTEGPDENYFDITPPFLPMRRLKVGTFKVESTGFRLGERFVKIIFDNALQRNVDEIYTTLYTDRPELKALADLLKRWGFYEYGTKSHGPRKECVLIKKMHVIRHFLPIRENFPNLQYAHNKYILPIASQYHTSLLPDSRLNNENEINFLGKDPHKYALQKIYITWASADNVRPGDFLLFYRMGENGTNKKYTSVLTTIGIVDQLISRIQSEQELLNTCQNRTVFSEDELSKFWHNHNYALKILKFIYVKSLTKRLPLSYLWERNIIVPPSGPRPFTPLSDEQFDQILSDSQTQLQFVE